MIPCPKKMTEDFRHLDNTKRGHGLLVTRGLTSCQAIKLTPQRKVSRMIMSPASDYASPPLTSHSVTR